jgi:carboxyl-terminal processing protease
MRQASWPEARRADLDDIEMNAPTRLRIRLTATLAVLALALAAGLAAARTEAPKPVAELKPNASQQQAATWAARFLTRFHYRRVPLDDAMSAEILKRYIDSLDSEKLFFTAADVDGFKRWEQSLDDAIYDTDLEPAFAIFRTFLERVAERADHSVALLDAGFDFGVDESLVLDRSEAPWAADRAELDEIWRKRVKNDWLRLRLTGQSDAQIRTTLSRRYRNFRERWHEVDADDVFQTFMNAYASAIEPHTSYMSPRASEVFEQQMRLSLEGIGAVLSRVDDYTVVRSVVRGGPAQRSGEVKPGDRIVGVGQGAGGPVKDVIGWRVDDVVALIRGPKGTTVVLDILPADAPIDVKPKRIPIVREQVKLEQQAARKDLIEVPGESGTRRIGLVTLPTFYHDFEGQRRGDPDYRSSTRDVARLIGELKRDGIDGLIIDLRDNGGGSLAEATQLAGLFIDRGPVVQVRDAQGRVQIESDRERGVAWDGPLAVLVNRTSASASEIFAAAMQDYGRALVIGQNTYGKGTVQNLIDLDQVGENDKPKFGQVKLTVAQFFRVNGGSTQHRGVEPDLVFPSLIDPEQWGESAIDNALPWTEIAPVAIERRGEFGPLVPMLEQRHTRRVAGDAEFQYLLEDVRIVEERRAERTLSLLESRRKAERDADAERAAARSEARKAASGQSAAARAAAAARAEREARLDDGLTADERPIDGSDDEDAPEPPDVLAIEGANILADAIELLKADTALAGQVKAFKIAERPTAPN